jgi:hypothetical protein
MAQDVVQTLRRQKTQEAEKLAFDAEIGHRTMELVADGEFGYRQEITTGIDPAKADAERKRVEIMKEEFGIDSATSITDEYRKEIDQRLSNQKFTLVQQEELRDNAEVYGLNEDDQAFECVKIEASIQTLEEWIAANPAPKRNRAERRKAGERGKGKAKPPAGEANDDDLEDPEGKKDGDEVLPGHGDGAKQKGAEGPSTES